MSPPSAIRAPSKGLRSEVMEYRLWHSDLRPRPASWDGSPALRLEPGFQVRQPFGEVGQLLPQLGEFPEDRRRLQPVAVGDGGITRDERSGVDGVRNAGLRRRDRTFPDCNVARDADLAGQRHIVFDRA